jgi:hypothetical protein
MIFCFFYNAFSDWFKKSHWSEHSIYLRVNIDLSLYIHPTRCTNPISFFYFCVNQEYRTLRSSSLLETPLKSILDFYSKTVVPRLTKKNRTKLLAELLLCLLYILSKTGYWNPPKRLRHIPYLDYFDVIRNIFKNKSYWDHAYRVILPQIDGPESNGIYMVNDQKII